MNFLSIVSYAKDWKQMTFLVVIAFDLPATNPKPSVRSGKATRSTVNRGESKHFIWEE
jgi:hypothetical protein